ncbi:hypothetical protein LHV02_00765 [Limosilactobacillus fermentum]|uniref:hypothetical protein n=1 Tax=Limosilactobacillus fermentum TaxID=1613 RepID=UPI001CFA2FC4|nr:hypothetical protein [Limosilactobacillus fermentum]MCH5396705.1 hypothetical protein [Limosilactobacillus fermentum]MDQ7201788.1 hypothetical protein [Limosilactobacillus fermentum]
MENHRLNKYWLIGPGVIDIILLVLALVHDFMPEIRLLMDLTPSHRAELLTMIRSNGIRDLIFMLLLGGGNERDSGPLQRRYLRFCRSLLRPVDRSLG